MKRIFCAVIAVFLFSYTLPANAHGAIFVTQKMARKAGCGVERWPVKTLTDADVVQVDGQHPLERSVTQMRALNGGKTPFSSRRIAMQYNDKRLPAELHAYRIRALLTGWKQEADRDFHVVGADPTNPKATMIFEPPDPDCPGLRGDPWADDFGGVRAALVKCFGEPPKGKLRALPGRVVVEFTAVGFYDIIHGQDGVAPNGIEGHPAVKVRIVSGTCPKS